MTNKRERFTRNIHNKQDYCEFELKRCKYQNIYDFEDYHEIEDYVDCDLTLAIDKLGQLEDIEEEIGIDLITLFSILRTGGYIWVKNHKGINYWHIVSLRQRGLDKQWYLTYSNNIRVKLKDYGNTWSLNKEDLQ